MVWLFTRKNKPVKFYPWHCLEETGIFRIIFSPALQRWSALIARWTLDVHLIHSELPFRFSIRLLERRKRHYLAMVILNHELLGHLAVEMLRANSVEIVRSFRCQNYFFGAWKMQIVRTVDDPVQSLFQPLLIRYKLEHLLLPGM